jgi:hypothetical protein
MVRGDDVDLGTVASHMADHVTIGCSDDADTAFGQ